MATASCTLVRKNYYNGGWKGWDRASGNAGSSYPYVLEFTTPSFLGASASITFDLTLISGSTSSPTLRYGIATSADNKDSYAGGGEVSDPYKFVGGTWSVTGLTSGLTNASRSLTIETTDLKPNTTYYLYLWNYNGSYCMVWSLDSCTASLDYVNSLVYIDNGTNVEAYMIFVDNGSGWDQHMPYVDNGSGWDLCS